MFPHRVTAGVVHIVSIIYCHIIIYDYSCSGESITPNNVCTTFEDYNFMATSSKCYYHPDVEIADPETLIRNHVGKVETYRQVTRDGYMVTAHRVPRDNPKGIILLAHPLIVDAIVYVAEGNSSLAFLLWNEGYDVWLPSNRGTVLSPGHVTLKSTDYAYSNFSFHEIGTIDTQLWVAFVSEKTKRNDIVYIGHSMSSTAGLIYSSLLPDEAKKYVKVFILMAPAFRYRHVTTAAARTTGELEPLWRNMSESISLGGIYESSLLQTLRPLSTTYPYNRLAILIAASYSGWTPEEFDPQILAFMGSRIPRGISMKTLYHYVQIYTSGKFQQFDYGPEGDKLLYGRSMPPEYPLSRIQAPVYLMCSDADALTTLKDCDDLYNDLPESAKVYGRHTVHGMNHVDYHVGKHRIERVFNHLIQFINKLF